MTKLIDIIIPCYKSHKTIKKTLSSIASQVGAERVQVSIIHRPEESYLDEINRFSGLLDIQSFTSPENASIGKARQIGIDNTKCKYIMFCDSDDILHDNFVLEKFINTFEQNAKLNAVYGQILALNDNVLTPIGSNHWIWIFGSMFKREFLAKNEIRYTDTSAGEDCGFNKQVKMFSDINTIKFLNDFTYVWTDWNKENRVNTVSFAFVDSKKDLIKNTIYAINHARKKRPNDPTIKGEVVGELCNFYFQWREAIRQFPDCKEKFLTWCKLYYQEIYRHYEKDITEEELAFIFFENQKRYFANKDFYYIDISIKEFLQLLKN